MNAPVLALVGSRFGVVFVVIVVWGRQSLFYCLALCTVTSMTFARQVLFRSCGLSASGESI